MKYSEYIEKNKKEDGICVDIKTNTFLLGSAISEFAIYLLQCYRKNDDYRNFVESLSNQKIMRGKEQIDDGVQLGLMSSFVVNHEIEKFLDKFYEISEEGVFRVKIDD